MVGMLHHYASRKPSRVETHGCSAAGSGRCKTGQGRCQCWMCTMQGAPLDADAGALSTVAQLLAHAARWPSIRCTFSFTLRKRSSVSSKHCTGSIITLHENAHFAHRPFSQYGQRLLVGRPGSDSWTQLLWHHPTLQGKPTTQTRQTSSRNI